MYFDGLWVTNLFSTIPQFVSTGIMGQTPEFDEYTVIIRGQKQFVIDGETIVLKTGESIKILKGTRVQYSNPFESECEYIAICMPAFSIDKVHREE